MKEQNINMSREELEKIWCKNNANVPRMESEYPATPEEAIMLNGKDVMKVLTQHEFPTVSTEIWNLPEGYQFKDENGNVINATKIILEKKKPKYPSSYAECCRIIGALQTRHYFYTKKDAEEDYPNEVRILRQLDYLRELLICRDAYWKIAGDWKPDSTEMVYSIGRIGGTLIGKSLYHSSNTSILEFPTREMRDAFHENFKELIEECKELL